jgi:hypothetical protein
MQHTKKMMHLGLMLDDAYAMLNEGLKLIKYLQYAGLTRRCYNGNVTLFFDLASTLK